MKTYTLFSLLITSLLLIQSCSGNPITKGRKPMTSYSSDPVTSPEVRTDPAYNNTNGYEANGNAITSFDCPDSRFFPPIDLKSWDKIQVVNGRLPTYAETMNGTSIHHYGEKESWAARAYGMKLPKLAYHINTHQQSEFKIKGKDQLTLADLVVVIQIVQTPTDTIVGYRYLTGGCGGSVFRDFYFLTDEEVKHVVEQAALN